MTTISAVAHNNCLSTAQRLGAQFGFQALLAARNEWIATLARQHSFKYAVYAGLLMLMEAAVLIKLSTATDPIPFVGVLATFLTLIALLVVRRSYVRQHPGLALSIVPAEQKLQAQAILAAHPCLSEGIASTSELTYLEFAYLSDMVSTPVLVDLPSFA